MAKQEITVTQSDGEVVVTEYREAVEPIVKTYHVKDSKIHVDDADVPLVLKHIDGAKLATAGQGVKTT